MKRISALVVVAILILYFVSCDSDIQDPAPATNQEVDQLTGSLESIVVHTKGSEVYDRVADSEEIVEIYSSVGTIYDDKDKLVIEYVYYDVAVLEVPLVRSGYEESYVYILVELSSYDVISSYIYEEKTGNDGINHVRLINLEEDLLARVSYIASSNDIILFEPLSKIANSWSSCMDKAIKACYSDWECGVKCSLVFKWCIAAIAIACEVSPI